MTASQAVADFVEEFANGNRAVAELCLDLLELEGLSLEDGLHLLGILKKLNWEGQQLLHFAQGGDAMVLLVKLAIAQYDEAPMIFLACNVYRWKADVIAATWKRMFPDKPLNTWGVKMPEFDPSRS